MNISQSDYEYLLGVYLGDGHCLDKYGIAVTVDKKLPEYAQYLCKLLSPYNAKIHIKKCQSFNKKTWVHLITAYNGKFFFKNFIQYKNKGLWTLPNIQYPEYFLAGIFDTDGSIRIKKGTHPIKKNNYFEIVFYQHLNQNLLLLLPLFDKLNLFPTFMKHSNQTKTMSEMWVLRFSHYTQIKIFARFIRSQHPGKKEKLQQALLFHA